MPTSSADLRRPVIVAAGQLAANRGRTPECAREPLVLAQEALEAAGVPALLPAADAVYAVHIASWAYDDLAARVAAAVGARPRVAENTGLGGHLPVRLLDRAADRIWSGESEIALVVGAEAQSSVSLLGKAGIDPVADLGWSANPGGPPGFDLSQLGSTAMQATGLMLPTRMYPLFENRLTADLGLTPEQGLAWSAQLYAALSRIAADHPDAWNREALTVEEIGQVSATNRMVCEPYPLAMNAMPHVDQAAALVVTSLGVAQQYGITDAIHVWGGAGADDTPDVLSRPSFGRAPALSHALDRCLAQAELTVGDLDLIDVYSCFPVVPKLVGLHLGLPRDQALSVTGGHSSFGGPLNSYSLHALASMVQRLRAQPGTGLVHANGGFLTTQHAVILSSRPAPAGYVGQPEPHPAAEAPVPCRLPAELAGDHLDVVVETATVEHDRTGQPRQAFLVARTADGTRVAAATPAGDVAQASVLSVASLPLGRTTQVGRALRLRPTADGAVTVAD